MLPKTEIKQHTKYAVYSHLFSCFLVMFTASFIPSVVSSFATRRIFSGVNISSADFDAVHFFIEHYKDFLLAEILSFLAIVINLPFEYLLMRYYFILSGTPANAKCSLKVFFSGMENVSAFLKGALIVLIISVLSALGIIVGYYPVFLTFCMAPFYLALDPKLGVGKALSKSRALMKGHKKETFLITLEFIIMQLVASIFSAMGVGLISVVLEAVAQSLFYTCLAVVFVQLDRAKNKEKSDIDAKNPSV